MSWSSVMLGSWSDAWFAAVKVVALLLTAIVVLRVTQRRTLTELAPFDWVTAISLGAIVGRSATSSTTTWLTGAVTLTALLGAHALLGRLRYLPWVRRLTDPPLLVLVRDGQVIRHNLRRSGVTLEDLDATLRHHGHTSPEQVELVVFEANGSTSVLQRQSPS